MTVQIQLKVQNIRPKSESYTPSSHDPPFPKFSPNYHRVVRFFMKTRSIMTSSRRERWNTTINGLVAPSKSPEENIQTGQNL